MPQREDIGMIVRTDARCVIMGLYRPGIPTIIWRDGTIEEAAADWLRDLAINYNRPPSTLLEYAKILRPFLRFCREKKRSWKDVDDNFLLHWQQVLLRTHKVAEKRASTSLGIIFQFYLWAQEEANHLQAHVATSKGDPNLRDHIFAISARRSSSRRGVSSEWTWPYLVSAPSTSVGRRHTPTETEIRDIHVAASRRKHAIRNTLIYMWAEFAGPRRFEVIQLGRRHLPSRMKVQEIREAGGNHKVKITRKGGKTWSLEAPADLLEVTWDWVDGGMKEIADQFKSDPTYRQPDEIFLSEKTGLVLHKDSLTKIARLDFAEAGVENASLHRLRARFAVELIEREIRTLEISDIRIIAGSSVAETILTRVASRMGQRSTESLRPYLNHVLERRTRSPEAVAIADTETSVAVLERRLAPMLERIASAVESQHLKPPELTATNLAALDLVDKLVERLRTLQNLRR